MTLINNSYRYKLCTAEQCRKADQRTIEEFGVDGFTLMETAGLQSARYINDTTGNNSRGLFICGKGNNAGDALVSARYLSLHHNHACTILLLSGQETLSDSTRKNLSLLEKMNDNGVPVKITDNRSILQEGEWDYIVDGMLGTGLNSPLRQPYQDAVDWINRQNTIVFSLDIPTGLNCDTGLVMGSAVQADYTLCFGARKLGLYIHEGPDFAGNVNIFPLTFPNHVMESTATVLLPEQAGRIPPVRRKAEHKYSNGILYLIGGSIGLTGAAIMAARSAWKSGIGALFLISPEGLLPIYESTLPQMIKVPVGSGEDNWFQPRHTDQVLQTLEQKPGTLLIGPGLGRREETLTFVHEILSGFSGNTVVDADALLVSDQSDIPSDTSRIITPHLGELKWLGISDNDPYDRLKSVKKYSSDKKTTVVSKGYPTIVGTPDGQLYITGYDTRIFSRAGFGDVLSGKIAGYFSITGDTELSVIHALLDGHRKFKHLNTNEPHTLVEPEHLI